MSNQYNPLSKKQKAQLSITARKAYAKLSEHGLTDLNFADWRHQEQQAAVGCSSLTKCVQRDYLPLRAHFNSLTGADDKAFTDHLKSQPANDKTDADDTPERRDQIIKRIEQELDGSKFNLGYACAIARNKFKTTKLANLTTTQLTQLLMTIKARVAKASK